MGEGGLGLPWLGESERGALKYTLFLHWHLINLFVSIKMFCVPLTSMRQLRATYVDFHLVFEDSYTVLISARYTMYVRLAIFLISCLHTCNLQELWPHSVHNHHNSLTDFDG